MTPVAQDPARAAEILQTLGDCCAQRISLRVRYGSGKEDFCTRVQAVYPQLRRFDIDAPGPNGSSPLLNKGAAAEFWYVHNHMPYHFRTQFLGPSRNGAFYTLAVPDRIESAQRRAHYRVSPPVRAAVHSDVVYHSTDSPREVGTVNLSLGGILIYDELLAAAPEKDQSLNLSLKFDSGDSIAVSGVVRRTCMSPSYDKGVQIGVQFSQLQPQQEAALSQILMRWQREMQRNRTEKR